MKQFELNSSELILTYKLPKRLQSSDDSSDICHTRASFWHNKRCECTSSSVPHKPKEPYKIGQANDESQTKMRKLRQPVTQKNYKKVSTYDVKWCRFSSKTSVWRSPKQFSTKTRTLFPRKFPREPIAQWHEHRWKRDPRNACSVFVKQPPWHPKNLF